MAEELNFEQWIESIGGLTENGRSKLEKATIVSLAAVRLITEPDIDEIRLGLGDRVIFKAGWKTLTGAPDKATPIVEQISDDPPPPPPNHGSGHFSLQDLAELLKTLPA